MVMKAKLYELETGGGLVLMDNEAATWLRLFTPFEPVSLILESKDGLPDWAGDYLSFASSAKALEIVEKIKQLNRRNEQTCAGSQINPK